MSKKSWFKSLFGGADSKNAINNPDVYREGLEDRQPKEPDNQQKQKEKMRERISLGGGPTKPSDVERAIRDEMEKRRTYFVDQHIVSEGLAVVRAYAKEAPKTRIGTIKELRPLKYGQEVEAVFITPERKEFSAYGPIEQLLDLRAVYSRDNRAIGILETGIGGFRTAEHFVDAFAGQIRHEIVHALRQDGLFTGDEWKNLLDHAEKYPNPRLAG